MQSVKLAKQLAWCALIEQGHTFDTARQQIPYFYSGSRGIHGAEFADKIQVEFTDLYKHNLLPNFENTFLDWLNTGTCQAKGLETFKPSFSAGVTQSIDSFVQFARNKKLCFLEGEYFYAPIVCNNLNINYKYIKDASTLHPGHAVIISLPFADTGSQHKRTKQILDACDEFNIPVMIDACYWMLARDLEFDFNRHCIKSVAFSLSKAFPVSFGRIGVRYTRPGWHDGQTLHSDIGYNNRISASIGLQIMEHYNPSYLVHRHEQRYISLCNLLGLNQENNVLFATGNSDWHEYSRQTLAERYGIEDKQHYNNRIFLGGLLDSLNIDRLIGYADKIQV